MVPCSGTEVGCPSVVVPCLLATQRLRGRGGREARLAVSEEKWKKSIVVGSVKHGCF